MQYKHALSALWCFVFAGGLFYVEINTKVSTFIVNSSSAVLSNTSSSNPSSFGFNKNWHDVVITQQPEEVRESSGLLDSKPITTGKEFIAMISNLTRNENYNSKVRNKIIVVWHSGGTGGMCNRIQQFFSMLDFASTSSFSKDVVVYVAVDSFTSRPLKASLDLPYLYSRISSWSNLRLGGNRTLTDLVLTFDWTQRDLRTIIELFNITVVETRPTAFQYIGRSGFSWSTAIAALPALAIRDAAIKQLDNFRGGRSFKFISVHRRTFGHFYLNSMRPFCMNGMRDHYADNNNITFTPELLDLIFHHIRKENLTDLIGATPLRETANKTGNSSNWESNKFAFFMGTDFHDLAGDGTFTNGEVKTLMINHPPRGNNNWDTYMLIDMHASVLASYSLGNPWSSCDRILAHWKSPLAELSKSSESFSDLNEKIDNYVATHSPEQGNRMFPNDCFRGFYHAIFGLHSGDGTIFANYEIGISNWRMIVESKIKAWSGGLIRKVYRRKELEQMNSTLLF